MKKWAKYMNAEKNNPKHKQCSGKTGQKQEHRKKKPKKYKNAAESWIKKTGGSA